jgi:hypothetical protein
MRLNKPNKMFSTSKKFKQWKQWYLHAYSINNKNHTRRHIYRDIVSTSRTI